MCYLGNKFKAIDEPEDAEFVDLNLVVQDLGLTLTTETVLPIIFINSFRITELFRCVLSCSANTTQQIDISCEDLKYEFIFTISSNQLIATRSEEIQIANHILNFYEGQLTQEADSIKFSLPNFAQ